MTFDPKSGAAPAHAPIDDFAWHGSELLVAGQPLSRLAERAGQTPFYVVERRLLRERVDRLRAALPEAVELHYAMKANPMPALVAAMSAWVDGIDVASAGELKIALDAAVDPRDISFAGPGKREAELRQAVAAGVLVNVESVREIDLLDAASRALGLPARVAVRINPDFELKGSAVRMSGAKPFGIDSEQVPAALRRIEERGLAFEGFHVYAGSQNLRPEAICEAQRQSFDLALRLAAEAPAPLRTLNLGGGFGIPYFPGEQPLELGPIGANLGALVERARRELPETTLVLELGRYLVGEAGLYVARIVDRKVSRGQVFLVTDGGLHHHLSASGHFGQVIRKNYPVAISRARSAASGEVETASVVGPLCTPLDLLADRMVLPVAAPGDLVVVFQSGAYGASASPQAFLGHPPALELLI